MKLKICIANLETTIEELEQKISKKRIEIKIAIKDSSRSKAKIILKQVKHLDLDLEKKMTSVENLRQVLESIQDVKDNKKVIETLKSAKNALHEETKGGLISEGILISIKYSIKVWGLEKHRNFNSIFCLVKSLEIVIIFLPAFYLTLWLMK